MSRGARILIVNADDFGQSAGVNGGVARAHEAGIVTSASLMVRGRAVREAAAYARRNPALSVGLHVELGEWYTRDGEWTPRHELVPAGDAAGVRREVERQLAAFRDLLHRDPSHVDSHQHVHLREPARTVVQSLARRLHVPLRHFSTVRYCGEFYGQEADGTPIPDALAVGVLVRLIRGLRPGATELGCHPAVEIDFTTSYADERLEEVRTLCDPAVRAAVVDERVELASFHAIG